MYTSIEEYMAQDANSGMHEYQQETYPDSGYDWSPVQLAAFDFQMRSGRIDKKILTNLLVELRDKRRKYGNDYPVSNALGYVFNVVIDKNLGNHKWRGYTNDWKQEMRDRAIELLIKHSHNFDPEKMEKAKNADPYYYLGKITFCAFIQAHNKLSARSKKIHFVPLNEGTMSTYSSIDEFAVDTNKQIDEGEKNAKESGDISTDGSSGQTGSSPDEESKKIIEQLSDDGYNNG